LRKPSSLEIKAMTKENNLFNPPFKDLHSKIKSSQEATREPDSKQSKTDEAERDDKEFFLEAMSDVIPLPGNRRKTTRSPGDNIRPAHPAPDDEQEAMTHLYDLVKGSTALDITFTDEYMEGSVKGFSRKLMKKLGKGEFPVQDYIDLHGLTKQEAETRVRDFLLQSYRLGLRCVLIVHGRGLNSPDSFPVLKERLPIWLNRGPAKKIVVAFATARPYDGGAGAIYVLLRKR
jgi:DNA-nicking Smr family endonuclease